MVPEDTPNVEIVVREVQCTKELLEVGEAFAATFKAARDALSDGWQPGEDIPHIAAAAMSNMLVALDGASKIPAEFRTAKKASVNAIMVPVGDVIGDFLEG